MFEVRTSHRAGEGAHWASAGHWRFSGRRCTHWQGGVSAERDIERLVLLKAMRAPSSQPQASNLPGHEERSVCRKRGAHIGDCVSAAAFWDSPSAIALAFSLCGSKVNACSLVRVGIHSGRAPPQAGAREPTIGKHRHVRTTRREGTPKKKHGGSFPNVVQCQICKTRGIHKRNMQLGQKDKALSGQFRVRWAEVLEAVGPKVTGAHPLPPWHPAAGVLVCIVAMTSV